MSISRSQFIQKSPLINQVREVIRLDHKSLRTEDAYIYWITDFVFFHGVKTHPAEMGEAEVTAYLSHLASERNVAAATQNQAFNAILFLYSRVLNRSLGVVNARRATRPTTVPVILSKPELTRLFAALDEPWRLLARLGYGTGLRLMELLRLRVKDFDFDNFTLQVWFGKGDKSRLVPMPTSLVNQLQEQVNRVRIFHQIDCKNGYGSVWLPHALETKWPKAATDLKWQWAFPSPQICRDPRSGQERRHHLFPTGFQAALRNAAQRVGITKRVSPHILRHSGATHLLEMGKSIVEVKDWLGHKDIKTTMIYTHVVNVKKGQPTPVDCLCDHG